MNEEITYRVQSGWDNLRKILGVLCDSRIKIKVKGRLGEMEVRPAMVYGAETWPVKKVQEKSWIKL